jgi:hypothetical protein
MPPEASIAMRRFGIRVALARATACEREFGREIIQQNRVGAFGQGFGEFGEGVHFDFDKFHGCRDCACAARIAEA